MQTGREKDLVFVDFDAEHPRGIHIAERIDLAVVVGVVLEELKTTGLLVVGQLDPILVAASTTPKAADDYGQYQNSVWRTRFHP